MVPRQTTGTDDWFRLSLPLMLTFLGVISDPKVHSKIGVDKLAPHKRSDLSWSAGDRSPSDFSNHSLISVKRERHFNKRPIHTDLPEPIPPANQESLRTGSFQDSPQVRLRGLPVTVLSTA